MPPQQIATIHGSPAFIRKNQIFRFAIFRPLPSRVENCPQDSERIQRNVVDLEPHFAACAEALRTISTRHSG